MNHKNRRTDTFLKFIVVGTLGTILNLSIMFFLVEVYSTPYTLASFVATEISIIHNFFLNNIWTFSTRNHSGSTAKRLLHFNAVSLSTLLINVWATTSLTDLGTSYLLAQALGITAAFSINYLLNNRLVFAGKTKTSNTI